MKLQNKIKTVNPIRYIASLALVTIFISSCSPINRYGVSGHKPLVERNSNDAENEKIANNQKNKDLAKEQRFKQTPSIGFKNVARALNQDSEVEIDGEPVSLNVDSVPLPTFINEVFGNILNQSFQISPRLLEKKDLVTLRLAEKISRKDLFYTIKQLLETYGVAILTEGEVLRFVVARGNKTSETPLFVTGMTLPSVPATHRPIFQVVPLNVVKNNNAVGWLKNAFAGQSLVITQDPYRNAIWLQGKTEEVQQAAEVIKILDQPLMRGRYSMRIEPMFLGADKLTARLIEVLKAEGFYATNNKAGAINLLPIIETNSIIVFATAKSSLDHVKKWVIALDKPLKQTTSDNLFFYTVQNTSADNIVKTLNKVQSRGRAQTTQTNGSTRSNNTAGNLSNNLSGTSTPMTQSTSRLVVDEARNAILYKGNVEQWAGLLPIIKKMDKPDLQVLVEVIVAEVKLSENFSFGIEWAINNAQLPNPVETAKNAITIGAGGLNYFPMNSSGSTRAVLSALATNSNVRLLQTPKILVLSGEEASINVGDEVPIVTSQTTLGGQQVNGTTALTQSVQYRSTGNTLSIKPTIYSGGRVSMQISQEISSAQLTDTSNLNSPTILNRSLSTNFSVTDGGSVLIGGLIQSEDVEGESRVPFLSDIPFIGELFTQKTISSSRTELMILVIPYIIRDKNDAEAVTKAFQAQLELHD